MRYLLLAILLMPMAVAITPLEAGTMEARLLITNTVGFEPTGNEYHIDEATGKLTWYPRDDSLQDVMSMTTEPLADRNIDHILYTWENPGRTEDLSLQAQIFTRNAVVPVRGKIPFPLESVSPSAAAYLGEGEIIRMSPAVQRKAQELAAGKDDAYEIVYTLADWTTTNVEYSLASLGEPAIQSSAEVLESRFGKCDELTALFIAMNRALGIPARFVAGYSYTNSDLLAENWGGHGWAEVWFPDHGWIPFDVTYGEYGYLDAGHVKLKISEDAKETSIDYTARGRDFTLQTEPLDIYVTPLEMSAQEDDRISISLDAPYKEVGFGSTVLILATVQNEKDYYVATRLDLARTTNTEMLSDSYENVLLGPNEVKTVPMLVRIDDDLDPRYRYEFPFRVSSKLGQEDTITIEVVDGSSRYEEGEYDDITEAYTREREQAPFSVTCDPATGYVGTTITHECTVMGPAGDTLRICADTCTVKDITDGSFTIPQEVDTEGTQTREYTASALGSETSFFVITNAVTETDLGITIEAPDMMEPGQKETVLVRLNGTGASVDHLTLTFSTPRADSTEDISRLPATVRFTLPSTALRPGENTLTVEVRYDDELGSSGQASATHTMTLSNVSLGLRIIYWLEDVQFWIEDLFT